MPDFDAIVIGTGQAGPFLAFRLAGAGTKGGCR
jgi:pyruvate/2-oxoglutarate dehydrogenase complex dihydrolipoamide dehydrogenase (E3) component